MNTTIRLTVAQRQSVICPTCGAMRGRPCKGSRIPGANTLGGGWGGPTSLQREHAARVADVHASLADPSAARVTR